MENAAKIEPSNVAQANLPKSSWQRTLVKWFAIVAAVYGIGMTLALALKFVLHDSFVLVALFSAALHLLLIPPLILLPLCLLLRRWRAALTLVPSVVVFAVSYGALFLPHSVNVPDDAPTFTLLTYNIHEKSDQEDMQPIIQVIRAANADVVSLQEVSFGAQKYLIEGLSDVYPYQAMHPKPDATYGNGVLSRFPLLSDEYWSNYRGHMRTEFEVGGRHVVLYNTHPRNPFFRRSFNVGVRQEEIDETLRRASADAALPVVIAGDFNMTDQTDAYASVVARYSDSFRETGWGLGFTFTERWLGLIQARLDYIFHNDHLRALEARIIPDSASSDHNPVLARLALILP